MSLAPNTGSPDFIAQVYSIRGEDKPGSEGLNIEQHFLHPITNPFPYTTKSLLFSINQTPEFPQHDLKDWAVVDTFEKSGSHCAKTLSISSGLGPPRAGTS